jgi:hypothetical protein
MVVKPDRHCVKCDHYWHSLTGTYAIRCPCCKGVIGRRDKNGTVVQISCQDVKG